MDWWNRGKHYRYYVAYGAGDPQGTDLGPRLFFFDCIFSNFRLFHWSCYCLNRYVCVSDLHARNVPTERTEKVVSQDHQPPTKRNLTSYSSECRIVNLFALFAITFTVSVLFVLLARRKSICVLYDDNGEEKEVMDTPTSGHHPATDARIICGNL